MKRLMQVLVVIAILISTPALTPTLAYSIPGQGPIPPGPVYLPFITTRDVVSGQVLDANRNPVPNVSITTDTGKTAITNANGEYTIQGMDKGLHTLSALHEDYSFAPAEISIQVQGRTEGADFTALQEACTDAIVNGGFEAVDGIDGWNYLVRSSDYAAVRDNTVAHAGAYSARTGIIAANQNKASYSSVRHPAIYIPADASSAILRLWVYPLSDDLAMNLPAIPQPVGYSQLFQEAAAPEFGLEPLAGDAQYIQILTPNNAVLQTPYWQKTNTRAWTLVEIDLTKWRGRSVKVEVGTYNDGLGGTTAMYVDDVSFTLCSATSTGTACANRLDNSSFENDLGWKIPITAYSAGYSTLRANTGTRSMRTGIVDGVQRYSYSDAWQTAYIPLNATSARLKLSYFTQSTGVFGLFEEPSAAPSPALPFGMEQLTGDTQYLLILNTGGYILDKLIWEQTNTAAWKAVEFNLMRYRGMTIRIQFGTYNNGTGGTTAMFVDDLMVDVCTGEVTPTATPTVTLTPTVGPTATATATATTGPTATPGAVCAGQIEKIGNNSFETIDFWEIPATRYSAGYYPHLAHSGVRSMRTGIVNTLNDRYSYSDFRQTVTIPYNNTSAKLGVWLYQETEEPRTALAPTVDLTMGIPAGPSLLEAIAAGNDAQYILVLDYWTGEWIDTLYWNLRNDQEWIYKEFDVRHLSGRTIMIQFGTYNDGLMMNGRYHVTSMFVDDVTLKVCP